MKALIRNSSFNLAGQVVSIATALACVPIAFRYLGTERFGLLALVWSLLSYAIMFDLGTGPAVARAAAASLVREQGRRIAAIMNAGMLIQLVLGVLALLIIAGLAPVLPRWLKVPPAYHVDATNSLYALALTLPFVLLAQSQQAVLEAIERFDLVAYVRTPTAIATYAIPAYGALAGWSLARMIVLILVTRVIALAVLYALCRAYVPPQQAGTVRAELPGLFRYGRWLAISGALTQVMLYLDRFLLSAMHGLTAVAQYAAPYDAATKLLVLPSSIGVAMFPGLAKDSARNQTDDAAVRCRTATRLTMAVLIPVCTVLFIFADGILHWWLGPGIGAAGVTGFRILLGATLLHALSVPPVVLIEAVGRSDIVARYSLAEIAFYLPVVVLAILHFGVIGAASAWLVRTAILALWSTWYARRWLNRASHTVTEYANAN
jgi:O-antigen/teichoic acid export membrane protein